MRNMEKEVPTVRIPRRRRASSRLPETYLSRAISSSSALLWAKRSETRGTEHSSDIGRAYSIEKITG